MLQASRFVRELFKNPRAISAIVPPAPAEGLGGRLPYGGCLLHGATLVRLCDCVLACRVVSRGHVPLYAIVAVAVSRPSWLWLCRPGRHTRRAVPWLWLWCPSSFRRRRVVATRRRMLVFAVVCVVSMLTQFALHT